MMIKLYKKFNEPLIDVKFWDNGQKKCEIWYLNNKLDREDGPAEQHWFYNGQKHCEVWYLNNKYHREDGPAYKSWYRNGRKFSERWCLNDIEYSREEWIEELKKIGSPHYDEQRMLLDMEKYNI